VEYTFVTWHLAKFPMLYAIAELYVFKSHLKHSLLCIAWRVYASHTPCGQQQSAAEILQCIAWVYNRNRRCHTFTRRVYYILVSYDMIALFLFASLALSLSVIMSSNSGFYRACSAKRGLASACRPSVCLSATLVDQDHLDWNTSKIISRLISLRLTLGLTLTWAIWCNGNTSKIGWNRGGSGAQKPAISSKRCSTGPRLLWRTTNRKSHTRFRLVPKSMTLDDLERPKRHSCRNRKGFTEPTRKKIQRR